MAETTIEWTSRLRTDGSAIPGYTYNPWIGCTKVSPGCKNCYAATWTTNRMGLSVWGPQAQRRIASEAYWKKPARWNQEAQEAGERRIVFCASLADVFEGPETCQLPDVYARVQEARTRLFMQARDNFHLDWLFLTKRPENIERILSETRHQRGAFGGGEDWWTLQKRNPRYQWWFGTSVEDQETADKRVPLLRAVPAAVRFLSCEPLLEPVTLDLRGIHWVIVGGESGSGARPLNPNWVRSIRDQCAEAGVAFYFKQSGEFVALDDYRAALPENACRTTHTFDDQSKVYRLGKKLTGAVLDGREHRAFPRGPYSIELGEWGAPR